MKIRITQKKLLKLQHALPTKPKAGTIEAQLFDNLIAPFLQVQRIALSDGFGTRSGPQLSKTKLLAPLSKMIPTP